MVFKSIIGATCTCLVVASFNANSALVGRDFDGNLSTVEAYYDDVTNLTWLADANYAQTSGYDADGLMTWGEANGWAASLSIAGVTGWRLPDTNPVDGTTEHNTSVSNIGTSDRGYNVSAPGTLYEGSTASEMAYLFYNTLGNLGYCDPELSTISSCSVQSGSGLTNTGSFINIQSDWFWSATEFAPVTGNAWAFNMDLGFNGDGGDKSHNFYAWAVQSGDVGAAVVPIPSAVWLFGSGLIGLIGLARRKA